MIPEGYHKRVTGRGHSKRQIKVTNVTLICAIPVDDMKPVIDIIGSQVVMFQIICMFPDIYIENGEHSQRERSILILGCHDGQLSGGIDGKPCIAGAKYG